MKRWIDEPNIHVFSRRYRRGTYARVEKEIDFEYIFLSAYLPIACKKLSTLCSLHSAARGIKTHSIEARTALTDRLPTKEKENTFFSRKYVQEFLFNCNEILQKQRA
jgi:hypothetical protein